MPKDQPLKSLITGAGGQTGFWLGLELEEAGRRVLRASRQGGNFLFSATAEASLREVLDSSRPDEIYHLACPSLLEDSAQFERDVFKMSVDVTLIFLRWIVERSPNTRFFFAGSSEIFGQPAESPQNEASIPSPEHPYALAKYAGQQLVGYFRKIKGVFAVTGILYNHESQKRRGDFVSKKIVEGVASIFLGKRSHLKMGNLKALRDWTHAADFAKAMRLSMEAQNSGDYVFASGESRSVEDFCRVAFSCAGLDYRDYVIADRNFFRPDSRLPRVGNITKARRELGWEPSKSFETWVGEMVREEIRCQRELLG